MFCLVFSFGTTQAKGRFLPFFAFQVGKGNILAGMRREGRKEHPFSPCATSSETKHHQGSVKCAESQTQLGSWVPQRQACAS